jgi:2-keto-3-deoxy-L-rhamnonate aldolase RhmA
MIENKERVEHAQEILAVAGVDGCFLGPYDMTGSYGILGQTGHRLIREAMQTVADAARRNGKAAGQHIVTPTSDNVALAFEQGYTFVALGMDSCFLSSGASGVLGMVE